MPSRADYGEFLAEWIGNEIHIRRADPRILVSDVFIEQANAGLVVPGVTLDGAVLRIEAANRTVIYRIMGNVPQWQCHIAEWPD